MIFLADEVASNGMETEKRTQVMFTALALMYAPQRMVTGLPVRLI